MIFKVVLIFQFLIPILFFIVAAADYINHANIKNFQIALIFIAFYLTVIIGVAIYIFSGKNKGYSSVYNIDLTLKDLIVLLFYKKLCPQCSSKMKRIKEKIFMGEGICEVNGAHTYGNKYNIKYYYRCEKCNRTYKLSEIGKMDR
ncbi:MAG: hypothetical protein ACRC76_07645 [Proteocatella sp.]